MKTDIGDELDHVLRDRAKNNRSTKRKWAWISGAAALLAVGYFVFFGDEEPAEAQDVPVTVTVDYRSIGDVVAAAGFLGPIEIVDIGAQVSGLLDALHVAAGDHVLQGDVLAEIDATIQRNVVASVRAQLEASQARLPAAQSFIDLAQAGLEREERLMEAQATNRVALDEAQNQLITARSNFIQLESEIESQKALVASEEAKLNYSMIFAPISGVVISISARKGQTLNAAHTTPVILQMADLSRMVVQAQVAEANVGKLMPGAPVSFGTLGGGTRRWRGKLQRIIPKPASANGIISYTAAFEVDNNDGALLPGMTAQVFFDLSDPREVLAAPVDMLVDFGDPQPGGGRSAWVRMMNDSGGIEAREIVVGEIGSTHAEILTGLKEGDRLVSPSSPMQ